MPSVVAALPVHDALVTAITQALDGWLFDIGASRKAVPVYDGVADQKAPAPYVIVGGSSTEAPFHTLGATTGAKFGGTVRIPVRVVTQYPATETQTYRVLQQIKAAIDQQPLTVSGFPSVAVSVENATLLTDTIAGVVTRELVADVEVFVHQS